MGVFYVNLMMLVNTLKRYESHAFYGTESRDSSSKLELRAITYSFCHLPKNLLIRDSQVMFISSHLVTTFFLESHHLAH